MNKFKKYSMIPMIAAAVLLTGCEKEEDEVPEEEHDHEVFTDVKLIFTSQDGDVVEALAKDPDFDGAEELKVLDAINLKKNTDYTLTFEILNVHDDEHEDHDEHEGEEHEDHDEHEGEDHDDEDHDEGHVDNIGAEIKEEDDEHQFFFEFSKDVFANPLGNGNIDNASDPINYLDLDEKDQNVGLETSWTTSSVSESDKSFRVVLMHQRNVKTDKSSAKDGDADFDLTFVLNIE